MQLLNALQGLVKAIGVLRKALLGIIEALESFNTGLKKGRSGAGLNQTYSRSDNRKTIGKLMFPISLIFLFQA